VSPTQPTRETQLFVVHVWRQHSHFRASVRRVDLEETQVFTTPTQVARYLAAASSERRQDAGASQPPSDAETKPSHPRSP
jgi:hypothetical protein